MGAAVLPTSSRREFMRQNLQIGEGSSLNEGLVVNFIKEELKNRQQAALRDYMLIAERIQKELDDVYRQKQDILAENTSLQGVVTQLAQANKSLEQECLRLETMYHQSMLDIETSNDRVKDLELGQKLMKNRNDEVERDLRRQLMKTNDEFDKRIKELGSSESSLRRERDDLLIRVKDALNSRVSNEEYQNYQKNQLNLLTVNFTKTSEENDRLKKRVEMLLEDKKSLSSMFEQTNMELRNLRDEFHMEKDRLTAMYESRLKQKDLELEARPRMVTTMRDTRITHLGALNLLDQDMYDKMSFAIPHRQSNTNLERVFIPISDRNMPMPMSFLDERGQGTILPSMPMMDMNYSYTDVMNDINYLEQISKKDDEIAALQIKVQELRKKLDQGGEARKDEELTRLRLEVRHLSEKLNALKTSSDKEKKLAEKNYSDLVQDHIALSSKLQLEISDKDNKEMLLMKKIKNLNYTVLLYKEQIEKFNRKSK